MDASGKKAWSVPNPLIYTVMDQYILYCISRSSQTGQVSQVPLLQVGALAVAAGGQAVGQDAELWVVRAVLCATAAFPGARQDQDHGRGGVAGLKAGQRSAADPSQQSGQRPTTVHEHGIWEMQVCAWVHAQCTQQCPQQAGCGR